MREDGGVWQPVCPPPTGLVRPVALDPDGRLGPTRGQAAGPRWRRTSQGRYVPTDVNPDVPEQRILEQAARLPGDGVVTGWASCRLHQGAYFDGTLRADRFPSWRSCRSAAGSAMAVGCG